MKTVIILIFLSLVPTINLFAQTIPKDSVLIKTKIAKADARHFKSTRIIRMARRKRLLLNSSDYFMPTAAVKHPQFLTDSVYVQAYKDAAYNKSVHHGKGGYYAVVAAEIVAGAVAGTVIIYLLLRAALRRIDIK